MPEAAEETPILGFDDIVKAVQAKECILFLGAGVHYPPPKESPPAWAYPENERPPLGGALATLLADASPLAADPDFKDWEKKKLREDLQRVSLYYEVRASRKQLVDKVREAVSLNKKPSHAVRMLAELDFPVICTTNYDRLFERALYDAGKEPVVSSYSRDWHAKRQEYPSLKIDPLRPFLFKIHGDINDPGNSIVITDEDYIHFIKRMITGVGEHYPIPESFRFYVKFLPILFIGFSLMDYNLRLLFRLMGWEGEESIVQASYSVGPYPDGLIRKRYDPPVKFIVRDVWTFVPELYRAVKGQDYRPAGGNVAP